MRKTSLLIIIVIIINITISCVTKENVFPGGHNSLQSNGEFTIIKLFDFEYDLENYANSHRKGASNFVNTAETEINTPEDVVVLAKNELIWEYNTEIAVYYDELTYIWKIAFSLDNWLVQYIYIDNTGRTLMCIYPHTIPRIDDDVVLRSVDEDILNLKLNGGIKRDSGEYKNITETIKLTKKSAIELAKIEVTIEYDRIFVGFDNVENIWEIVFWVDDKPSRGQYIFIDDRGITQTVIERPFIFKSHTDYIEFLKERDETKSKHGMEFKNILGEWLEIDNNFREKVIALAMNELTAEYEYNRVVVYHDTLMYMFMISFWEDDVFEKGSHVIIDRNGVTQFVISTMG